MSILWILAQAGDPNSLRNKSGTGDPTVYHEKSEIMDVRKSINLAVNKANLRDVIPFDQKKLLKVVAHQDICKALDREVCGRMGEGRPDYVSDDDMEGLREHMPFATRKSHFEHANSPWLIQTLREEAKSLECGVILLFMPNEAFTNTASLLSGHSDVPPALMPKGTGLHVVTFEHILKNAMLESTGRVIHVSGQKSSHGSKLATLLSCQGQPPQPELPELGLR
jgi:hypothetical protein